MDALAMTNYVLAGSGMVAAALTIVCVLFGKRGGMAISLLIKPARMGKDGLSGWAGPLVTVGGWLGMLLGSHQDPTFWVFADLCFFFGALFLTAFLCSKVASSWQTKIGCHIASGVAIWAVLGQIGATWYILGYLSLTTRVMDAFRATLVAAVVLVVVYDMQAYIKLRSRQAPSPAVGVHSSTRPRVAQQAALFNEVSPTHASLHPSHVWESSTIPLLPPDERCEQPRWRG
jgi:hypothetical protein